MILTVAAIQKPDLPPHPRPSYFAEVPSEGPISWRDLYRVSLIMTDEPIAHADGHYFPRHADEFVPGKTAVVQNVIVRFEDAVLEPVVGHKLADVFDGV